MTGRPIILSFMIFSAAAMPGVAADFSLVETRHFSISVDAECPSGQRRSSADTFEAAYTKMEGVLGTIDPRPIDVVIFSRTGDFTAETGLPVWSASAMIDGAIYMQPAGVLAARGVLETAISHEVCLVFLARRYGAGMPAWLAEGLAVYHSGEIETVRRGLSGARPPIATPEDIDALLLDRADKQRNRWGYVLAYEAVASLMEPAPQAHARTRCAP